MSFFQRVFHYVFNEILVDRLANSKVFQNFAVRSNEFVKELSEKGTEQGAKYSEQVQEFSKVFREEMKKGMDEQFGKKR